jgi:transposase InsO family protein
VHKHRSQNPSAAVVCQVLEVTRSGYYAWSARQGASPRQQRHQRLLEQVRLSHLRSQCRYGAPKITEDLNRRGIAICLNTVAKILRECGLRARVRRRFVPRTTDSTHPHPIAPNRLNRCFTVDRANAVWVGDISYIRTGQGWLYLATLMDLFSRKIVGWAMADHLRSALTCDALTMAIRRRRPAPGLICHSDRGVQYACRDYQQLLIRHGLLCSMSRRGDCYDNAPAESFFATLKGELIDINDYVTPEQARAAIFEFIEVFYNRKRMHSALDYLSPESFEATHRAVPKPAPTDRG